MRKRGWLWWGFLAVFPACHNTYLDRSMTLSPPYQACVEVPNSSWAVIDAPRWGISGHYLLERSDRAGHPHFKMVLNVNFFTHSAKIGKDGVAVMRRRAQACLDRSARWLNGPDGETLEIRLVEPSWKGPRPRQFNIEIKQKIDESSGLFVRGHWQEFRDDWDCPELMHEFFHQPGLVDEYAEAVTRRRLIVGPLGPKDFHHARSQRRLSGGGAFKGTCGVHLPSLGYGLPGRAGSHERTIRGMPGEFKREGGESIY